MTGRDPEKMLRAEARRYSVVAELLSRVKFLTDEEIDDAAVPLPWYRPVLKQMRDREIFKARIQDMTGKMNDGAQGFFKHGKVSPIKGRQGIYTGPDTWVKMINSEMQINTGALLFFPHRGGIWFNCSAGPNANVQSITPYCRGMKETTLDEYKEAWNHHMLGLHPDAPMTNDLTSQVPKSSQGLVALAQLGVRIG